jgi:alpha-glucosidase (family GH31 glycosyl hydrolase)
MNNSQPRCRRRPGRRAIWALAVLAFTAIWLVGPTAGLAREAKTISPPKAAPATVVCGKARFQALAPRLLRLEYAPSGRFVDAPSVAVINRDDWGQTRVTTTEADGWLTCATDCATLRYKKDSGAFTAANLRVTWRDESGAHAWKPGDRDDQNLGGVPGSLDNRSTESVTDPGPLSRKGCYLLDDSASALFDAATDWVKPRPARDGQDWFFLAYGRDYKSALSQLARLVGPPPMLPRYVFGSWFGSRAGYSGEQWKMIVKQFRDEHLPLDVLVIDSDSKTKMVWTGFDWDLEQVPDPPEFYRWMTRQHVKVTVNEHYKPLVRESDSHFEAIRQALGLPADVKEIPHDLSNKKYAGLFMDLLHKQDLDWGMAFWWQDGCAPANMPGLDPYLWTRHIEYQGSERITGRRTTAFCRLGKSWGSHRYGIYFTGDLHGVWESLPVLIPATVRGGNQLTPYMNNLCCGVFVEDLPTELYQRWVQFSSFSPFIWFHGMWGLRLPWEYGRGGMENYRQFVGLRYALMPYIYTCSRAAHETGLPLMRGTYLEYPDQEPAYAFQQQYLFGPNLLVAPITEPGNGKPVRKDVYLPAGDDWFDFFTGDVYSGGKTFVHECPLERMPLLVRAGSILPLAPPMDYSDQKPVDPLTLEVFAGQQGATFDLYEDDGTSLDYRAGAYARTPLRFVPDGQTVNSAAAPHSISPIGGEGRGAGTIVGTGTYTPRIGAALGKFKGQLSKRRYIARVHGLFKPDSVALNGRTLAEIEPGKCLDGWWWGGRERTLTVQLETPLSTVRETVLQISHAGTFADLKVWQKAWNLRDQVRQMKREMKLKHAAIVAGPGIKKPPRVIRVTEEVERLLSGVVDHPKGCSATPPDFAALEKRVVAALTDDPFESDRTLPEFDPESKQGMKLTKGAKFTPGEIQTMTSRLRGADLPAWIYPK